MKSDNMNIYQRINAVMKEVDYAQKDTSVTGGGLNYKGITHDYVLSVVRPKLYEAFYEIAFVNMDDPKDRAIVHISGHATDSGDKAPGKAVSYAVKVAILKLFGIETGENEESRNFDKGAYTDEVSV
jgi:hypothetical protein